MARYVHFDVRASRRSRKQIQPISSENIENCLVRFKSISSQEHIYYFRKTPREMGLFRESGRPIVSTLIGSASAWNFIASTLIPSMTEFVFFSPLPHEVDTPILSIFIDIYNIIDISRFIRLGNFYIINIIYIIFIINTILLWTNCGHCPHPLTAIIIFLI